MLSKVKFGYAMANAAMHLRNGDVSFYSIYRAAVKSGLTDRDAFNLTATAYNAKHNQLDRIVKNAEGLRRAAFLRLADANPYSLWAYALSTPFGVYNTDNDLSDISRNQFPAWEAWAHAKRLIETQAMTANPLDGG